MDMRSRKLISKGIPNPMVARAMPLRLDLGSPMRLGSPSSGSGMTTFLWMLQRRLTEPSNIRILCFPAQDLEPGEDPYPYLLWCLLDQTHQMREHLEEWRPVCWPPQRIDSWKDRPKNGTGEARTVLLQVLQRYQPVLWLIDQSPVNEEILKDSDLWSGSYGVVATAKNKAEALLPEDPKWVRGVIRQRVPDYPKSLLAQITTGNIRNGLRQARRLLNES
jgi:hypothetical protein